MMINRHPAYGPPPAEHLSLIDPTVPSRACCCLARPAVKVITPPTKDRPHPVDLWLCGHHYRASMAALELAGATVEGCDLTAPEPVLVPA